MQFKMSYRAKASRTFKLEKRWLIGLIVFVFAFSFQLQIAFASDVEITGNGGNLAESKMVTGTKNLLNDVAKTGMILAPLVAVVCVVFFFFRKKGADEMDQKKWNSRIMITLISVVGVELAGVIVGLITKYYA